MISYPANGLLRYIIPTIMDNLGLAGEFLRISEHYRRLSDGELLVLARQPSELTPTAQQALANEISERRLTVPPPEQTPSRPRPEPPPKALDPSDPSQTSSYDDDRQLVGLCTVWSVRDALQVQNLLDTAGIPFFMGPEKATGVDAVTSNFAEGVSVQIMNVGLPWARQAMQTYEPADDPTPKEREELDELPVRCPKCQSTEVVFEDLVGEPAASADNAASKFKWKCDSCGHQWEDDGVVN